MMSFTAAHGTRRAARAPSALPRVRRRILAATRALGLARAEDRDASCRSSRAATTPAPPPRLAIVDLDVASWCITPGSTARRRRLTRRTWTRSGKDLLLRLWRRRSGGASESSLRAGPQPPSTCCSSSAATAMPGDPGLPFRAEACGGVRIADGGVGGDGAACAMESDLWDGSGDVGSRGHVRARGHPAVNSGCSRACRRPLSGTRRRIEPGHCQSWIAQRAGRCAPSRAPVTLFSATQQVCSRKQAAYPS